MVLPLLQNASVDNKIVLVRVDLNVPIKDGYVQDDMRLRRLKETIDFLTQKNVKILLLSHFGRPAGKFQEKYSLQQLIEPLKNLFDRHILFLPELVAGNGAPLIENNEAIETMPAGGIALFENTRFYPGEETNDPLFAKAIATYGAIFVNEAFSASHRSHATVDKLTDFLPSYAGFGLQKELSALEQALNQTEHPIVAFVGGAKVSSKVALLENLVTKVDSLAIGGGMANSFLAAGGVNIGKSFCEPAIEPIVERILAKAKEHQCTIILPVDGVVAYHFVKDAPHQIYGLESIPQDGMILDIGPHSIERLKASLDISKTLLWNGPLGAFEIEPFDKSTTILAQYAAKRVEEKKLLAIAGGGDTVSALGKANVLDKFTYVSTGGGAFLEWLEGKVLPGIAALKR